MVEAIRHGCLPLLPDRLAYPEILPQVFHDRCLYSDQNDLIDKLAALIAGYGDYRPIRRELATAMEPYAWQLMAPRYDRELERLVKRGR